MTLEDSLVWAATHNTSVEIVNAIFALAANDAGLAEKIWSERPDAVLTMAFAKSMSASLIWDGHVVQRPNVRQN